MEFVVFGVCLTVIVVLVLYAYHATQRETAQRVQAMYASALHFQESVLQEVRLIRAQEQTERAQMSAERTNLMGTVNHLIEELRREAAESDERLRGVVERLRIELVQCVADAAADAMGHVRGEPVARMELGQRDGVQAASLEDVEAGSMQGGREDG